MVKHTQAIRCILSTNCLSVFDHFVGFAPKGIAFMDRNLGLIFSIFCKRDCFSRVKLDQWRKWCFVVSVALPQSHIGFSEKCEKCCLDEV